jgi:S1-C subfamily serine protease
MVICSPFGAFTVITPLRISAIDRSVSFNAGCEQPVAQTDARTIEPAKSIKKMTKFFIMY